MCLIRMVIGMGWPPGEPAGEDPRPVLEEIDGPPYSGLEHADLFLDDSVGNLMVGELVQSDLDSEHAFTPMLHLIDLGSMEERDVPEAIGRNIFAMGCVMILLITLDHDTACVTSVHSETCLVRVDDKPPFLTRGVALCQKVSGSLAFPWLDRRLRSLVCECLAADSEMRADPKTLLDNIKQMVQERNEEYYTSQFSLMGFGRVADPLNLELEATSALLTGAVFLPS
ncbi:hypothetical protein HD806DRAFT_528417 [Xylariaceae sp. AK1471]|nr:hypothetical protein HD806DRAFT_528417 [Xylariaceae sp. AK1471]